MTSKRSSTDSPTSNNVVTVKRPKFNLDSEFRFTPTSQEELDIGILRIQNKRLSERLNQRKRIEEELRTRIETLEKKQLNDDTKFYVIIRYWNQLNDNVRVILEKFDPSEVINSTQNVQNEDSNESTGPSSSGEDSASFWRQLQNIDKEEMEQSLQQRVQLSTSAVGNIVAAFEKILQRNEKVSNALKGTQSSMETSKDEDCQDIKSPKDDDDDDIRRRLVPNLDESVRELNEELTKENRNLHNLVTSLHQKHHTSSLKQAEFKDKLELKDNQIDEFKNRIDELEFELNQAKTRCQRLENHLYEAREKIQDLKIAEGASEACKSGEMTSYSTAKIDDLKRELEEQKELALSRLTELEQLNNSHRETLKMVEKYKMDLHCIPDSVIRESPEYKSLQSNFSVLYNQSSQIKTQMDEARNTLMQVKNEHLKQIEQMEADELSIQKELKDKLLSMDDSYAQVRKDYDMLRIEFEQTLAANEQNSPIHREIRALVTSSQTYSQQLKDENARIKKKLKEAHGEIGKLKSIIEQNGLRTVSGGNLIPCTKVEVKTEIETKPVVVKSESDDCDEESSLVIVERSPTEESKKALSPSASSSDTKPTPETPSQESHLSEPTGRSKPDEALIRELKIQLKKEQDSKRELKIMLDMFKSLEKEKREKAQIMINEKKVRMELDELKKQHKNLSMEADRRGDKRRVVTPDEFTKKVVKFEEIISQLESKLSSAKQEEEALLLDMDLTGTAFEDMREQNTRLIQQLREKDDANFKIISERIKLTQINKMYAEEKEAYSRQVIKTGAQLEAQVLVIQKLEEKERIYLNTIASMEKEIQLRQQAVDSHKRRALEFAQQVADLKLHLEKYVVQIRDAQSIVADKTSAWQQEAFKTKRLQEEVQGYKRKYERAKKFELAATADEVLHEEIRELKEQLTCPSCKTKRKDAVLNKCFHVFCYDCLKTRYETRQRKCPKCNQSFSANDFHRLYLG